MTVIQHLTSPATLPSTPNTLSVLSYNVLLPNSQDGWWNYKMYNQPAAELDIISSWDYRRKLIKDRIKNINPDVICMQEVSPISFESDFAFMKDELGYDGQEMFKRGRFRPATFWRTSKCSLVCPAVHKDRTLLTAFKLNLEDHHSEYDRVWYVLNCHLQAGPEGKRRLRQIDEGVKASVNLSKKMKEKNQSKLLLIVCGDFNGGSESGAVHYLETGCIGPSFVEDGEAVSSKDKKCPLLNPLIDVATTIPTRDPPSTLVVAELICQMVKHGESAYEHPNLSEDLVSRLSRIYSRYASCVVENEDNLKVMSVSDVKRWLVDINKQVGRGSEFRTAAKEMGYKEPASEENDEETYLGKKQEVTLPEDGILTLSGFLNVYLQELRGGKFWGIAYDLHVMGEPLPYKGVFEARYDRMYFSSSLSAIAVLDTLSAVPCPNNLEPSDHLPVAATFKINHNLN